MSIPTMELIEKIEQIAPPAIQESWDNSGWQIQLNKDRTEKILIALEITKDVIQEAKEAAADLVLVHHPLLFYSIKSVDISRFPGCYIDELMGGGISVYAAHTSFDSAAGGMNDTLARLLQLEEIQPFPAGEGAVYQNMARAGRLKTPLTFHQVCGMVKKALKLDHPLRITGDPQRMIHRMALCGGAGGDLIEPAIYEGIDLFLTGDIKHHQAQWAKESGLCLIDGTHWGTERHFTEVMAGRLRETFGDRAAILISACDQEPFYPYI